MEQLIGTQKKSLNLQLPSWIHHDSEVRYTVNCTTHQGRLHLDSGNQWSFTVHNKLESIIKEIKLDNLPFTYQILINENILQPGWPSIPSTSAFHVSASNIKTPCPSTLSKALNQSNIDHPTWLEVYKEEYNVLRQMNVYNEITHGELHKIQHKSGRPILIMCVLTIKYKDGYPDQTKCRIVVLDNQQ